MLTGSLLLLYKLLVIALLVPDYCFTSSWSLLYWFLIIALWVRNENEHKVSFYILFDKK